MPAALDPYIPNPDIRERFDTIVKAPADLVLEVAASFDLYSLPIVRAIFWLRERMMRAKPDTPRKPQGLLAEMRGMGWGLLVEQPGRLVVCGATCQPWMGKVVFRPLKAEEFAAYDQPDQVKIAWTLEAESLGPATTRFAHETRAVATDARARAKFLRYWRWARFGIITIRLLLMPAIRRQAMRRWRGMSPEGRG
jgi:hypothetical protein